LAFNAIIRWHLFGDIRYMFRNYFKTAWRSLRNNKGYSALNILGLATGMAVALLIGLWVYDEYSYNKFLPGYQQLYQVKRNFNSNGDTLTFKTTSLKLADALRHDIPEIEYVAECDWMQRHGLMVDDKKLYKSGARAGSDFLKMFQYPLLAGNAHTVLKDPYSIVLTESMAKALFGNENPINKMVRFDNKDDLKVTGILKDLPANSSLKFNYVVPFSYFEKTTPWVKDARTGGFGNNSFQLFVRLKPGVSYAQVAPKIRNIEHTEKDNYNAMHSYVIMQSIERWHLFSKFENGKEAGGFIEYVRMFSIIGVLVLLIACINFINLTTARSEKRAKEVGVRKAVGSGRRPLIVQFLTESFLLTFIAFICCLLLVQLALPAFNTLAGTHVNIPFSNPFFWLIMMACIITTALVAGGRPAFYLSSFQPVKVLKGRLQVGRAGTWPRKILVVLQFSCSVALIISTIIIYRQVRHAKDRPAGYDPNRLLITHTNDDLNRNFEALKNEMIQKRIVTGVTRASSPATDIYWHTDIDQWPGKNAGESVEMGVVETGADYFKTLGIKIEQGRDFTGRADTGSIIFNEAAVKRLRLKDPVNQLITFDNQSYRIVGVAHDALMISPFAPAEPTMFFYRPYVSGLLMYRMAPRISTTDALTQLTALFNKYNPAFPYSYEFADENYAAKFDLEVLIGRLSGIFAGLAIFISCLGLFGLAAYVAEQRTKEIGIRKVLGASVLQVWLLLSKDFIVLVIISCVIASPVAFYFLQNWLQQYDYRIGIGPVVFILAAAAAILITIITISFQAIRAALANPVRSLRSE
jgi:putative ABC transport system permease protein